MSATGGPTNSKKRDLSCWPGLLSRLSGYFHTDSMASPEGVSVVLTDLRTELRRLISDLPPKSSAGKLIFDCFVELAGKRVQSMKNLRDIVDVLKKNEEELHKKFGIRKIGVFGSMTRKEGGAGTRCRKKR